MKAILFDLFETLITEREAGRNTMDIGTPECDSPAALLGMSEAHFETEWVQRRPGRMKGHFPDYYAVIKNICESAQLDVDPHLLKSLNEHRLAAKKQPYQTMDNQVIEMLQTLKECGLKIGLVSNCSGEETEGLFLGSLASLLDEIVLSYQEGMSKPQQEIYQLACDRLGVMPSEAIFIGDGGADELAGARKAGLKAFRATWFYDRQPYDDFPCLNKPNDVVELVQRLTTHSASKTF